MNLTEVPWYEFVFKQDDLIKGVPHRLIDRYANAMLILPDQYLQVLLLAYTDGDWNSHYLMTNNADVLGLDTIASEFEAWKVSSTSKIEDVSYALIVGDARLYASLRREIQRSAKNL